MKITKDKNILAKQSKNCTVNEYPFYKGKLEYIVKQYNGKMQGCSCIQIGFPVKCFVRRNPRTKEFTYVFNPRVLFKFGARLSYEGCLSIKDRHFVWRPLLVFVEYYDEHNTKHKELLGWKKTRIFMHEMDHLAGLTIEDKGRFKYVNFNA